jgi:hypothetical protein
MTALLYLKTRRAGGESLRDTAERLAGIDIPRSRWQLRMRGAHARATEEWTTVLPTPSPDEESRDG